MPHAADVSQLPPEAAPVKTNVRDILMMTQQLEEILDVTGKNHPHMKQ